MDNLLKMTGISKSFGGNRVLHDVKLELNSGEVLALLGENGAGKSTLIKILGGIYMKDTGEICINGKNVHIQSVHDARNYGISIIHQELMLAPHLTVAENIFMGQELVNKRGFVLLRVQELKAKEFLDRFKMNINANAILDNFTIAQQQMIEIIRAVSFGAHIIVMDEPTSSLSSQEALILFDLIKTLKQKGVGIIYISHRLNELFEISDRVTVLRDGEYVGTMETDKTDRSTLVSMMVGRELSAYYTRTNTVIDDVVLEVHHLCDGKKVKDVSFDLKKGEVLGFAGLVGAGRTEAMKCLFGLSPVKSGSILLDGKKISIKNPKDAMKKGIAFVPEDRKLEGLFLKQDIRFNITITVLDQILNNFHYNQNRENEIVRGNIEKMQIKTTGINQISGSLSGGNQQKVLIGRCFTVVKRILILDEPTRGVDVKTKADIYGLINELAKSGLSIIMISSELPELINMSDRVVVLSDGYSTGILKKNDINQENIMTLATTEKYHPQILQQKGEV
jgi:ABC-type sugar transport system ATPase subunit